MRAATGAIASRHTAGLKRRYEGRRQSEGGLDPVQVDVITSSIRNIEARTPYRSHTTSNSSHCSLSGHLGKPMSKAQFGHRPLWYSVLVRFPDCVLNILSTLTDDSHEPDEPLQIHDLRVRRAAT